MTLSVRKKALFEQVKELEKAYGFYFFSDETMEFFNCEVLDLVRCSKWVFVFYSEIFRRFIDYEEKYWRVCGTFMEGDLRGQTWYLNNECQFVRTGGVKFNNFEEGKVFFELVLSTFCF